MADLAGKKATYEDLFDIPENMTGEIINGKLIVTPRPSPKHMVSTSALGAKIVPRYQFGEGGGPGGWLIVFEVEVRLGENTIVPDLAGWRKERFPKKLETNWIEVAPDWICEVLSPRTALRDRTEKMKIYAEHRVGYVWLIDPLNMTLEVFELKSSALVPAGVFGAKAKARIEPFTEIIIDLADLWLEDFPES
ncbi:MAG: Uma2 family endonuclease [Syntrophobacteraceae bacterium]|nr:Uma2 family endonuclease [Syntrophobacteraceae bacterium]